MLGPTKSTSYVLPAGSAVLICQKTIGKWRRHRTKKDVHFTEPSSKVSQMDGVYHVDYDAKWVIKCHRSQLREKRRKHKPPVWLFPKEDFAAWRELVGDSTCSSYEEYLRYISDEVEAIERSVAWMREELAKLNWDNNQANRTALLRLVQMLNGQL